MQQIVGRGQWIKGQVGVEAEEVGRSASRGVADQAADVAYMRMLLIPHSYYSLNVCSSWLFYIKKCDDAFEDCVSLKKYSTQFEIPKSFSSAQ